MVWSIISEGELREEQKSVDFVRIFGTICAGCARALHIALWANKKNKGWE